MQLALSALWALAYTALIIPTQQLPFLPPLNLPPSNKSEIVDFSFDEACRADCMVPLLAKDKECRATSTTKSAIMACLRNDAASALECINTCPEKEALNRYIPGNNFCQLECLMFFRRVSTVCTSLDHYRIHCLRWVFQMCLDCNMDCLHDDRSNSTTELLDLTLEGCDRNCQTNDLRRHQMCALVVPNLWRDCMDVADSLSYGCYRLCGVRYDVHRQKPRQIGVYRVCLRLGKEGQGAFVDNADVHNDDNIWC